MHIILAMLALSVLVFIHEWGHYIMAKRVGMRVEVFSVGFGRPIYSWKRKGVTWQIGILPFGGFVKIAGMEMETGVDPLKVKDGYFGKRPIDRLKVALAGPVVNIVFAFILFSCIYFLGGTQKAFQEKTHIIGYVDPTSELSERGVRHGDIITKYNNRPFDGFRDILYQSLIKDELVSIEGEKVDLLTQTRTPYSYELASYPAPNGIDGFRTIGVLQPARYCLFQGFSELTDRELAPLAQSGIQEGDRILWAQGEYITSSEQLHHIVNTPSALLTIQRGQDTQIKRVNLSPIDTFGLTQEQNDEIVDWKRALGSEYSLVDQHTIPYFFDDEGVIVQVLPKAEGAVAEDVGPLMVGDRILAVNGNALHGGDKILESLRQPKIVLFVQHNAPTTVNSQEDADSMFYGSVNWQQVQTAFNHFMQGDAAYSVGEYAFLTPVLPMTLFEYAKKKEELFAVNHLPNKKKELSPSLEKSSERYLTMGTNISDLRVPYNPNPFVITKMALQEMYLIFTSLFQGKLSPKWMSGPVGIVHVMKESLASGLNEGLFWVGLISLNLGVANLLPIPVLDGGHIFFSLGEIVTRRRLSPQVMEKLLWPFMLLLVCFFLFVTYHDLLRLFR